MIRYISLYDIMNDPEGSEIVKQGDEYALINYLHKLGFDIDKKIERQSVYHRPLTRKTNEPFYGLRFVGSERVDKDWVESGAMSFDARMEIYRRDDPEKYLELSRMSYYANFTGSIIDHIQNKGSVFGIVQDSIEVEEDFLEDDGK